MMMPFVPMQGGPDFATGAAFSPPAVSYIDLDAAAAQQLARPVLDYGDL
jgi:hypothetical protein